MINTFLPQQNNCCVYLNISLLPLEVGGGGTMSWGTCPSAYRRIITFFVFCMELYKSVQMVLVLIVKGNILSLKTFTKQSK